MNHKFPTVPSSVAQTVRATTCWCRGMMLVICEDAVVSGKKPAGGVSWSSMDVVQMLYLAGWELLLSNLVREEEGLRASIALLQVGKMTGSSSRVAAPHAHVREAGMGACGFEHVTEEWMACSSALLLALFFSNV